MNVPSAPGSDIFAQFALEEDILRGDYFGAPYLV